jgi:hypothetical protein
MYRSVLVLFAICPSIVFGATYKCVDSEGRVSYSSSMERGKHCSEVVMPSTVTNPPPVPARPAYSSPKPETQPEGSSADRAALKKQLEDAEKALDQAKKKLTEQENVRYGDEKNYQRVVDRLKPYQDEVARLEEQVRKLRDELTQTTTLPTGSRDGRY